MVESFQHVRSTAVGWLFALVYTRFHLVIVRRVYVNKHVTNGRKIIFPSTFNLIDFVYLFYKTVTGESLHLYMHVSVLNWHGGKPLPVGLMSAVGRIVIVSVASIASLIRIDITVLPYKAAHLDGVFRSFLSVILLQEQLNNPCCRTTVLIWLKRLAAISNEKGGILASEGDAVLMSGSDVPAGRRVSVIEMIDQLRPPLKVVSGAENIDRSIAWRRLVLLFVRVENPTLKPYAMTMQARFSVIDAS